MVISIRNILSVISGLAASFLLGLILFPLVQLLFEKYFDNYTRISTQKDPDEKDLVILATVMTWILISSIAGGFVCSLIATKNEWLFIGICIILLFLTFIILSKGDIFNSIESMLSMLMIPVGFVFGRGIAMAIKTRRVRRRSLEMKFENSSADIE